MDMDQLERVSGQGDEIGQTAQQILESVNDWPHPVSTLEDFVTQVESYVQAPSNKRNIEACLRRMDFSKEAWYAESLAGLVSVFKGKWADVELKEVLLDLQFHSGGRE